MTGPDAPSSFRLAYVPGVTPGKWVRIWHERLPDVPLTLVPVTAAEAADVLRERGADAALLRLPIDRTGLSAIPLYTETTVVVVPKDHLVAAAEEVSAGRTWPTTSCCTPSTTPWPGSRLPGRPAIERPATTEDAVELVAAGVGLLVLPQSLARLHHRRDLTYRPLRAAPEPSGADPSGPEPSGAESAGPGPGVPESRVALSWIEDETTDLVEQFIGIVRGRTVNSTRGRDAAGPQPKGKRSDPAGGTGRASASGAASNASSGKTARRSAGKPAKPARKGARTGSGNPPKNTGRGKPRRRS